MAIAAISKVKRDALKQELEKRYYALLNQLEGKPLERATEGCKKGHWVHPEQLVKVETLALSLAVGDFKTILDEIKKVK